MAADSSLMDARPDDALCACGHTAHWHANDGRGDCEGVNVAAPGSFVPCECEKFAAEPGSSLISSLPCDCAIPTLEGVGQHAPGCAVFWPMLACGHPAGNRLLLDGSTGWCKTHGRYEQVVKSVERW